MRGGFGRRWLPVLAILGAGGCRGGDGGDEPRPPARYATLEQNWTPEERRQFYFTSQGSQIVPYDWFLALEQADATAPFRDDANLRAFGYLAEDKDARWNPDGLPAGFVKDDGSDRAWLGLSCAACHTSQVEHKGIAYRIDGGAALADVRAFLSRLTDALKATRDREDKFLRFSASVLGAKDAPDARGTLKAQLAEVIGRREGYNARNFPAEPLPLPGRVDALGAILNESFHLAVKSPAASVTANTAPANAPVSYPVLWDTPQHDFVQWNGAVKNSGLGALGRNVGEVLGVFGDLKIDEPPSRLGYRSSVRVKNLLAIEEWVRKLWSPRWPAALGEIDPGLRDSGRKAYEKAKCNACHHDIDRTDRSRRVEAAMRAVGTEELAAANFDGRVGETGVLEGAFVRVVGSSILGSSKLGAQASGNDLLSHLVLGTILRSPFHAPEDELTQIEIRGRTRALAEAPPGPTSGGGTYKARPLNGIWASAPYLHNGSVPTLADLLLPARDRPKSFAVGAREYDPEKVGFRTDAPGFPTFRARTDDGRPVPGNSNEGHEFGTEGTLDDQERRALLEYLKSL